MGLCVCDGAMVKCSFGTLPSVFSVLPVNRVSTNTPAANIMDNKPMANVMSFGVCTVLGSLCTPLITLPWFPGSQTVNIGGVPALNSSSKLMCNLGGIIEIKTSGQSKVKTT